MGSAKPAGELQRSGLEREPPLATIYPTAFASGEKRVPLKLTTRWTEAIPIVVCHGRIVEGAESLALRDHIEKELAQQQLLILDFREVDFVDSSGLGMLVRQAMQLKKQGGELKLCYVSPRIETTLKTTKVNTILKSYPSEAEAIASFARPKKPSARKADVLCVTPSADLLAYLGQLLQQAGYMVSTADNLAGAESMLTSNRPAFLVIDSYFSATISGDEALRDRFNALIDGVSIVELPPGFATSDAGDAARQLVKHLRSVQSATPSTPSAS
jgi:anti-anti-sigma factor